MAGRNVPLNIDVAAVDRASPVLDGIQADVKEIEGEHQVDVTADDKASDALSDIRSKLDGLTETDRVIALKAESRQLEREVSKAESVLKNLSKFDGDTIRVRLEARDNASKKLDEVRTELRQLDGEDATVRVNATGLDDLKGAAGALGIGTAGGIAALPAAIFATTQQSKNWAIEVGTVAKLTGSTLEDASRLVSVFNSNGVETADLLDLLLNVNGVLRDNPELADKLNVKLTDGKSIIDLFLESSAGLGTAFEDAGQRGYAASQLFGEEGVRQVATIETRVGDLNREVANVPQAQVVTQEQLDAAIEMNRKISELTTQISTASRTVGSELTPELIGALGVVNEIVNQMGRIPGFQPAELVQGPAWAVGGAIKRGIDMGVPQAIANGIFGGDTENRGTFDPQALQVIINPPGTPAATNRQQQQYLRRNGVRLS